MEKDTSAPASPVPPVPGILEGYYGPSLLQWYAGLVALGELSAQDERRDGKGTGIVTEGYYAGFAGRVFDIAQALVTEGERRMRGGS